MKMLLALVTGNVPGLVMSLVGEALKAVFLRIKWQVVVERFVSRLLVMCLDKLERMTTNKVGKGFANDLLKQLSHPTQGLPMIEQQQAKLAAKKARAERKKARRDRR